MGKSTIILFWHATILAAAILIAGLSESRADTPAPLVRLSKCNADLKVGPGMNAEGRELYGCVFVGQNLTGAVFDNCDLFGVRIDDCNLAGTSFRGATLTGAKIGNCGGEAGAIFEDATVNGILPTDRPPRPRIEHSGVLMLSPAQLKSTRSYKSGDLRNCLIIGRPSSKQHPTAEKLFGREKGRYDFSNVNLQGAVLAGGDFSDSDFTGARINGLRLAESCYIDFKALAVARAFAQTRTIYDAKLNGRIRGTCDLSGMTLVRTSFDAEYCDRFDLTGAKLRDTSIGDITSDHLQSTVNYKQGDLSGLFFGHCDFSGCDFSGFDLAGTQFAKCDLTGVNFTDAVISRARFADYDGNACCRGLTVEQIKSTWNYKHHRMNGIELPKDIMNTLRESEK